MQQEEEACTSVLQKWNKPRKRRLESKKVEDITFSSLPYEKTANSRFHYKSYDPRPPKMRKTSKTDLEEFAQQLEYLPTSCGFLQYLSRAVSQVDKTNHVLPLTARSMQARVHYKNISEPTPSYITNNPEVRRRVCCRIEANH